MNRAQSTVVVGLLGVFLSACGGGGGSDGGSGGGTQPPTSFTVTTSTTGAGSGSISPTSRTVGQDSTTTFTISAAAGSTIASVSGCGGSLGGTTFTTGVISSSCTVTATFDLSAYTVTATGGSGGSISPGVVSVTHGTAASFTVTPSTGYQISSIGGCGGVLSGNTYTTGPVTAACSVAANFQQTVTPPPPATFTVSTSAMGTGSGTISPMSAILNDGQTATFIITATEGSEVESVTGCGGGLDGTRYTTGTISNNCTVTVTFSELAPPVANASSITVLTDQPYHGQLAGTSESGAALSFQLTSQPSHGTVTLDSATGEFEYLSAALYEGPDSFQFIVSDGVRQSSAATVNVTVRAWVGTLRIGTHGNEWTNGGIAALDDGDLVVAYISDQPQDGSPIIGGSDIALARFARNGIPYDPVQIPLADYQHIFGTIASQDGHLVLAYGTSLDVQGKQAEQAGTDVNPNGSIIIGSGVTIAVPFELDSSAYVSEIEIAGLHLNWGPGYLSDYLFFEVAPDVDGRPGAQSDVVGPLQVNYQLVGDEVLPPERIVGPVQHQLDAGRYWFLLSYAGDGDGFLLRTEMGAENSISSCVAEWTECRDESAVFIPRNRRIGYVVWGIAGTPTLSSTGILKITRDGGVLWSWTAPESIINLPRLATDTAGNIHALGSDRQGGWNGASWLFSFDESGAQITATRLEYLGLESGECRIWENARSLAVDPVGRVLVGGLLAIDLECHQDHLSYRQGAFLYALNPDGTVAWSIQDKATEPPHLDFISYIRATNAGTTAVSFLRSGANVGYRSLQVDPLGTLVNTRQGSLSMTVDDGAHDDAGNMLLVSQSFGEGILIARLDGVQDLDWEQQIRTTLLDGSLGEDTGRGAIFLEDGSALVVGTVTGELPDSPRRGGTDIVVIRVLPDGVVDY